MTAVYVDTSCLVAICLEEPGWKTIPAHLASYDRLVASNLLEAELRSALVREQIDLPVGLLEPVSWILPDRPLTKELLRVSREGYLRGADLWHLACALYIARVPAELTFATLDKRQAEIAAQLEFNLLE